MFHRTLGNMVGAGSAPRGDQSLGDYINRKYKDDAFNSVKAESKKLTFEEYWRAVQMPEDDCDMSRFKSCFEETWNAAQENK